MLRAPQMLKSYGAYRVPCVCVKANWIKIYGSQETDLSSLQTKTCSGLHSATFIMVKNFIRTSPKMTRWELTPGKPYKWTKRAHPGCVQRQPVCSQPHEFAGANVAVWFPGPASPSTEFLGEQTSCLRWVAGTEDDGLHRSEGTGWSLCRDPHCERLSMAHGVQNTCEHPQIPFNTKCFSASAAKEQVAQARVYRLLPSPAGSVVWIVWAKQELYQPPLCRRRTSSQVGSLPGAWERPKDGEICNRNTKTGTNKIWRKASVCDQAPEEPVEQRVKCMAFKKGYTPPPPHPQYMFSSSKMETSVVTPSQEDLHYEKTSVWPNLQQTLHPNNRRLAPTWQHNT